MPLLEIHQLSIHFQTPEGRVDAVRGVDLQLAAGETLAIVGESGAGKSQLFHAVMGLLPRNAQATGQVQFAGTALLNQPARRAEPLSRQAHGDDFSRPDDRTEPAADHRAATHRSAGSTPTA